MAVARTRIPLQLIDATGAPRVGASAHVKRRSTGATISVFTTESGSTTLANPGAVISDANGEFPGWISQNDLLITVTGGGLPSSTDFLRDAVPARGFEVSASLPASPVDGQLFYYEPSAGIKWTFRYNAAGGTYKWEFVGGAPAFGRDDTTQTILSSTYSALTGSPAFTAPFAGVYRVQHGATSKIGSAAVGNTADQSLFVNGVDSGQIIRSSSIEATSVDSIGEPTVLTAGHSMQLRQRSNSGSSTATYTTRFISVLPVRVG